MNYLLKSKPKYPHRLKIIFVFVLFGLLSLVAFLLPSFTRSFFYTVSRPLWLMSDTLTGSMSHVKDFFVFRNTLIKKNTALEDELELLRLKETDYDILVSEFSDLKAQLGRSDDSSRILSRVLSRPPRSPYDTLVIDAGTNDGVEVGRKVYLSGSVIIGMISSVTKDTSLVQLFSGGNQRQEAVSSRTGVSFELVGQGGANFQLEAPKDTDILWGDSFTYPGLSNSVIGNVYYIDINSQSAFKTVYIRIPLNAFSAQWVFIKK